MNPTTEARAIELAVLDLNTRARPPDQEIAELWGLADARSVRDVRASEAYAEVKKELTAYALSYAGDQVEIIMDRALEGLSRVLPDLIERVSDLLKKPEDAHPGWRPASRDIQAATAAIKTLWELSQRGQAAPTREVRSGVSPIPSLVLAESRTETVRQFRRVTLTVEAEGDVVDGEWS